MLAMNRLPIPFLFLIHTLDKYLYRDKTAHKIIDCRENTYFQICFMVVFRENI